MHPDALTGEGHTRGGGVAVDPCAEAGDGFGAFGQGDGPLVDVLAVEAVHEETFAGGLHGGHAVGTGGEAVLHAKDEPFDPGEEAGDVLAEGEEVVVGVVAEGAAVEGWFRGNRGCGCARGAPEDGTVEVGEPPDAGVFVGGPEGGCPEGFDF